MQRAAWLCCLLALLAIAPWHYASAGEGTVSRSEFDQLRRDLDAMRKEKASAGTAIKSSGVDKLVDSKYGPNAAVTTKTGKLAISGLVQVWYYGIQNDHGGLFQDEPVNGISDTGEAIDNDSFRNRRTELKFTADVNENVTAVVMIDPAREASSFPGMSGNTATFKRSTNVNVANVQTGAGAVPRMLQDAYINYHGVVPYHDFQIGQFKPPFGEEGIRSSGELDFVERSMLGQLGDARDLGATVHGSFIDKRLQYWLGIFDSAGNFWGSAGQAQNRSDDNDYKDFLVKVAGRPIQSECWGTLDLGLSGQWGKHGEGTARDPVGGAVNGLNRPITSAMRYNAYAYYAPGGPVKGLWFRGEWLWIKDRNAPSTVIDLLGNGVSGTGATQTNGVPFDSQGWYAAMGYKFGEGRLFQDCSWNWVKNLEVAFRYDTFHNVQVADLVNPAHTDDFATEIATFGVNYYIKGHNAKIQLNYNVVDDPKGHAAGGNRKFHEARNDNFVLNFQVAF